MIKYRFIEVSNDKRMIRKFPSKLLPTGTIVLGIEVLRPDGNVYRVVRV